jgi:hypothetical protein
LVQQLLILTAVLPAKLYMQRWAGYEGTPPLSCSTLLLLLLWLLLPCCCCCCCCRGASLLWLLSPAAAGQVATTNAAQVSLPSNQGSAPDQVR